MAWFDMSDTSTANMTAASGLVSKIINKCGNGNNLQQTTVSAQPKNNTRTLNGLPVLEFAHDGTRNDIMIFDTNDVLDQPFTVVLVGQSDQQHAGFDQAFMGRQTAAISGQWVLLRNGSFAIFQSYLFGTGGDSGATQTSNNNPNIFTVFFQDGDRLNFKLNNNTATQGSVRSGYDNNVTTLAAIGGSNGNSNVAASLDGFIAEIIVYKTILTTPQLDLLNQYLSRKWGVALTPVPLALGAKSWWSAKNGVTQSGGLVSSWANGANGANPYTQATMGNQPTYTTLGGLPVLALQGSPGKSMLSASSPSNGSRTFSCYTVSMITGNSLTADIFLANASLFLQRYEYLTPGALTSFINVGGGYEPRLSISAQSNTVPNVLATSYDNVTGAHTFKVNRVAPISNTRTPSGANLNATSFSNASTNTQTLYIHEQVWFDKILTAEEEFYLMNWFATEWRLPL